MEAQTENVFLEQEMTLQKLGGVCAIILLANCNAAPPSETIQRTCTTRDSQNEEIKSVKTKLYHNIVQKIVGGNLAARAFYAGMNRRFKKSMYEEFHWCNV